MKTPLSGNWKLYCGEKKEIVCTTKIPGDFHTALIESKIIPDPYYGFNEQDVLWVNKTDWTIERTFSYNPESQTPQNCTPQNKFRSILEITEADTIFSAYINDKFAGSGKNQFVRHRFDITELLKIGENKIKIVFYSAENEAEKINETLPYPVPYAKYDVYSPNRNLVRKCQCSGGWDWGPCLMVSGIYGDIFIDTVSRGLFDSMTINFDRMKKGNDDIWTVLADLSFDSFIDGEQRFAFELTEKNTGCKIENTTHESISEKQNQAAGDFEVQKLEVVTNLKKGKNKISVKIPVKNPDVWKISDELKEDGKTENTVYNLKVSYITDELGEKSFSHDFCFSALKCVSFKEKDGGRPIYFENNGRKIFAKGANWIPADSLPSRWIEENYFGLLKSTVEANMNCLRVWGGGIYEKECFYNICDRLGIIVWQDFMFACGLYPVTDDFLSNVQEEVEYQILRLQHHASIGVWCGNNENFGTLNWFPESRNNRDRYLVDYDRLYQGLIGKTVKKLDPAHLWWPSSPCAGPDDFADNWHQDNMGDMHYWSVWHEKKNFSAYLDIKPRFVSEFGYESFPSIECIKTYANDDELNFTSPVNEYHQRSPSGNSLMLESFSRYFRFPNGFENMVYLSQVQQAVAIKTAIDYWRSLEPYCMGAVVWQLNDVWPGPSWSSLEYGGKWKLLHYVEKEAFESVHLSAFLKDDKIHAFVINDYKEEITGTVTFDFYDFDGNKISDSIKKDFSAATGNPIEIINEPIENLFANETEKPTETANSNASATNTKPNTYFIYASFTATSQSKKTFTSEATVFADTYKHCNIADAKISLDVKPLEKNNSGTNSFEITVSTDKPAFFVSLDSHKIKGIFSKNCFTLLPEIQQKIEFTTDSEINIDDFKNALTVTDLRKTY